MTKSDLHENHNSIFINYRVTALYYVFLFFRGPVDFSGRVVSDLCPFDQILKYSMYNVCFPNFLHIFHVVHVKLGTNEMMWKTHLLWGLVQGGEGFWGPLCTKLDNKIMKTYFYWCIFSSPEHVNNCLQNTTSETTRVKLDETSRDASLGDPL